MDKTAFTGLDPVCPEKSIAGTYDDLDSLALADVSPTHRVWDRRKAGSDKISELYAVADDKTLQKHAGPVWLCSDTVMLSKSLESASTSKFRASSSKCRERHCVICQSARANKLRERMIAALQNIDEYVFNPQYLLLTLTVKNCPITELRNTLAAMNKSFRKMIRIKSLKQILGWIRCTEVTVGKSEDKTAHPHFHAMLVVSKNYFNGRNYITQSKWTDLWKNALNADYDPIVDVRKFKSLDGGVLEVAKAASYSVKPEELGDNAEWFYEYHRQVSGLRFIAAGGIIKDLIKTLDNDVADDIVESDDVDIVANDSIKTLFRWRRGKRKYLME